MENKKSTGKLRRLIKVLYFLITLPIIFIVSNFLRLTQIIYHGNTNTGINDYYIGTLYVLILLLGYILFTDFLRRIISYINDGSFNGFINYFEVIRKYFIVIIIGGIIAISLILFSQNLRNECTGINEGFDEYGLCSCDEGYIKNEEVCKLEREIIYNKVLPFIKEEKDNGYSNISNDIDKNPQTGVLFPGFTDKQIQQLYKDTEFISPEEKEEVQQQMYREILPKIKARNQQLLRTQQKNELYNQILNDKDTESKKFKMTIIRTLEIIDLVRSQVGPIIENDKEILKKITQNIENGDKLLSDYLKNGNEEILYQIGLKEKEDI